MHKRFINKNVLVTGGAAGLGLNVARTFAREGGNVFILDQNPADEVVAELEQLGVRAGFALCNVRDESSVVAAVKAAAEWADNKLDVLVNNAGFNGICQQVKDMKDHT